MKLFLFIILTSSLSSFSQIGFSTVFDSLALQTIGKGYMCSITDPIDNSFNMSYIKPKSGDLELIKVVGFQDLYFGFEHGGGVDSIYRYKDSIVKCYIGERKICYTSYELKSVDTLRLDTAKHYFQVLPEENRIKHLSQYNNRWGQYCWNFVYKENSIVGYYQSNCIDSSNKSKFSLNEEERVLWFRKKAVISSWGDAQYEVLYFSKKGQIKKIELFIFYDEGAPYIDSIKSLNRSKKGANLSFRYTVKYSELNNDNETFKN